MNPRLKERSTRNNPRRSGGGRNGAPPGFHQGYSAGDAVQIDKDFHAWLLAQAQAVRERRVDALDWDNIAEELDGMAAKDRRALTSYLCVMLTHLLKWVYQTKERELHISSWRRSILAVRQEIEDSLEESPGLANESNLDAFLKKAYRRARQLAAVDMGLSDREMNRIFPTQCPWSVAEFMVDGFLPDQQPASVSRRR